MPVRKLLRLLAFMGMCLGLPALAGTWVTNTTAPSPVGFVILLSNGDVLAQKGPGFSNWFRLSPDGQGHYANGQWTSNLGLNMSQNRQFFSSDVLPDGRVFVAGGEYGSLGSGNRSEIYDPVANQWSSNNVPANILNPSLTNSGNGLNGGFSDSPSIVLADGTVLIAPIYPYGFGSQTVIYDPKANSWSSYSPNLAPKGDLNETSWVKLPDDSILTIDATTNINLGYNTTERFIPSTQTWIQDANTPVAMYSYPGKEIGPGLLLPSGKVVYFGGTGKTLFYTPSSSTAPGIWSQGPSIPAGLVARDTPAAMMANGNVLCAFSPTTSDSPIYFYEFNPTAITFTAITSPTGGASYNSQVTDQSAMLELPDGNILWTMSGSQSVYIYQPAGSPSSTWKPAIFGFNYNPDGSLHIVGTQFNGLSQGAAFGDDNQMDSNFPLVRFTDGGGNVYYGRTYNWSSTGVQTGSRVVSTDCEMPAIVFGGPGAYTMQVVANGIASDPIGFPGPIWVDFNYAGSTMLGTYFFPFNTLTDGVSAVASGATILLKPGHSLSPITITKAMTINSFGGTAYIGR